MPGVSWFAFTLIQIKPKAKTFPSPFHKYFRVGEAEGRGRTDGPPLIFRRKIVLERIAFDQVQLIKGDTQHNQRLIPEALSTDLCPST